MIESPLVLKTAFTIGPVSVSEPVVVTWGLMAVLTLAGLVATRSLTLAPSRYQTVLELVVGAIADQIHGTMRAGPRPYVPLIGTLFLFHPCGQLVVAHSGRRAADCAHRN